MGYIYLASPYSHPNPLVMDQRFYDVQEAAVKLFHRGHVVFSPIVHWHEAATRYALPRTAHHWEDYNDTMLEGASELWVLMLNGWDTSIGILQEIATAKRRSKPTSRVSWPMLEVEQLSLGEIDQSRQVGNSAIG